MKRIFITARFKGDENREEIEDLCNIVKKAGFEDFCFVRDVENWKKTFDDPKELMARAKFEISESDIVLIDVSDKPGGGRMIEAGMAYALGKKVIVIAKKGSVVKEALRGIADSVIEYEEVEEIVGDLKNLR